MARAGLRELSAPWRKLRAYPRRWNQVDGCEEPAPEPPSTPSSTLLTARFKRLGGGVKLRGIHGEGSHFEMGSTGWYSAPASPRRHPGVSPARALSAAHHVQAPWRK